MGENDSRITPLQSVVESLPREPGHTAEELESGMNEIAAQYGSGKRVFQDLSFAGRTRVLMARGKPYAIKMAWWTMLTLTIIVVTLDINAITGGSIGAALLWAHEHVFQKVPGIAYIAGWIACYFIWLRNARPPKPPEVKPDPEE